MSEDPHKELAPETPDEKLPAVAQQESTPVDNTEQPATPVEEPPAQETGAVEANDLQAKREAADAAVLADSRRYTRRSAIVGGAAALAGVALYKGFDWVRQEDMQPQPLRDAFLTNAAISRGLFGDRALAPTYPLSRAETLRVNGIVGLKRELISESWRLQLVGMTAAGRHTRYVPDVTAWEYRYSAAKTNEDQGHDTKIDPKLASSAKTAYVDEDDPGEDDNQTGRKPRGQEEAGESDSTLRPGTPGLLLTMADILKLPRHELVTQFKCIEGWSQIVHWAGVRMADFLEAYPPEPINGKEPRFVYMETPDGDYYNGYDLSVLRHPQALLVTEMMGAPLTQFHGAPLRIHLPMKYGYKQIKRIGLISYTNDRPDDYWTKLGYDWYAGL